MHDLDDAKCFVRALGFRLDQAFTYADTREGHRDKEKRELIRKSAKGSIPVDWSPPPAKWWAFRLTVMKSGRRAFDLENVAKLFIDAFLARQIDADESEHRVLGLFPDDTIDHVKCIQVSGDRVREGDSVVVEVFGRL